MTGRAGRVKATLLAAVLGASIFVVAPAAASAAPAAAPASATISGTITDTAGRPRVAAYVVAHEYDSTGTDISGSPSELYARTGADGRYTIHDLAADHYRIEIASTWLADPGNPDDYSFDVFWGGSAAHPDGAPSFAVKAGENRKGVDMAVPTVARIDGTIDCPGCSTQPSRFGPNYFILRPSVYDTATSSWVALGDRYPYDASGRWGLLASYPGTYRFALAFNGDRIYADYLSPSITLTEGQDAAVVLSLTQFPLGVPGVYTSNQSFLYALYTDYLRRTPSDDEVRHWNTLLFSGVPNGAVAAGFVNSDEYRLARIDGAYQGILDRSSDAGGRLDWLHAMQAGYITTDDIETSFYASAEYFAAHGGTNIAFAKSLYTTLLHREGSADDYAWWANLVAKNGRDFIVRQFWNSPETIGARVSAMYTLYLGRVPDAAGLASWVSVALQIGDSGLRGGLTGSDEYFLRAPSRFPFSF